MALEKKDIQQGVRVAIPATKSGDGTGYSVGYFHELLAAHDYHLPYLAIQQPYTSDDNVRLTMVAPFPRFCLESFHLKDLSIF